MQKVVAQYIGQERIKLNAKTIQIFKLFLKRDHGFTVEQAEKEVKLITKHLGSDMIVNASFEDILLYKRIGATIGLNRPYRATKLWSTFENAIKHATYAVRLQEKF